MSEPKKSPQLQVVTDVPLVTLAREIAWQLADRLTVQDVLDFVEELVRVSNTRFPELTYDLMGLTKSLWLELD